MTKFRVPNWLIFAALFINMWLICFSIIFGDMLGAILGVFCISCFIFTYKLNQWEKNEKEKKQQEDNQGPTFR